MTRRLPIAATLFVGVAVAIMISLGIWQLQRADWKDAVIARAEANMRAPLVQLPSTPPAGLDYRRVEARCAGATSPLRPQAGESTTGTKGWRQTILCPLDETHSIAVALGVSSEAVPHYRLPARPIFTGRLIPLPQSDASTPAYLLIAESPPAGLAPAVTPPLSSIARNHRSYAGQWFLFAGIAALTYILALRRRTR